MLATRSRLSTGTWLGFPATKMDDSIWNSLERSSVCEFNEDATGARRRGRRWTRVRDAGTLEMGQIQGTWTRIWMWTWASTSADAADCPVQSQWSHDSQLPVASWQRQHNFLMLNAKRRTSRTNQSGPAKHLSPSAID